jgi:hypothetical protein
MDVRKRATRNPEVDRFGAGGKEQRAEALQGAVGEPDLNLTSSPAASRCGAEERRFAQCPPLRSKPSSSAPYPFHWAGLPQSRQPTQREIPRMLALPAAAARLRRGVSMIAVSVLVASMPLAVAQQSRTPQDCD